MAQRDNDDVRVKEVHFRNRGRGGAIVYDELSRAHRIAPGEEKKIVMPETAAKFFEKHSHKDTNDVLEVLSSVESKSLRDRDPPETPETEDEKCAREGREQIEQLAAQRASEEDERARQREEDEFQRASEARRKEGSGRAQPRVVRRVPPAEDAKGSASKG